MKNRFYWDRYFNYSNQAIIEIHDTEKMEVVAKVLNHDIGMADKIVNALNESERVKAA